MNTDRKKMVTFDPSIKSENQNYFTSEFQNHPEEEQENPRNNYRDNREDNRDREEESECDPLELLELQRELE